MGDVVYVRTEVERSLSAVFDGAARRAGRLRRMARRCSPEDLCPAMDPAHLLLWGECYHRDAED